MIPMLVFPVGKVIVRLEVYCFQSFLGFFLPEFSAVNDRITNPPCHRRLLQQCLLLILHTLLHSLLSKICQWLLLLHFPLECYSWEFYLSLVFIFSLADLRLLHNSLPVTFKLPFLLHNFPEYHIHSSNSVLILNFNITCMLIVPVHSLW